MGTGQVFEQKCRNKCIRLVFFFFAKRKKFNQSLCVSFSVLYSTDFQFRTDYLMNFMQERRYGGKHANG